MSRRLRTFGGVRSEKSKKDDGEAVWPAILSNKVEEEQVERVGEREEETHTDRERLPDHFDQLGLTPAVLDAVKAMGFEQPTLIQAATIPALMQGDDVMGQAKTGTGKTAAFGLPAISKVDLENPAVQVVVLCPTRELCMQVETEFTKFAGESGAKSIAIYGGQPMKKQLDGLKENPQMVVGTPGRVIDHLRRGTLDLSQVMYAVLDEADEMLDMGFIDDIRFILQQTPRTRQTALFSATFPPRIRRLARGNMNNPRVIHTSGKRLTVESVKQIFYEVEEALKLGSLCRLLDQESLEQAVIFCRTRWETDLLAKNLTRRGYEVQCIHGNLSQSLRSRHMEQFREGKVDILVATDVAARGLDIPAVSHVINYHLPQDPEVYVHRIGRTARMGAEGYAISLISTEEYHQLVEIQEKADVQIEQRELPSWEEIEKSRRIKVAKGLLEEINPEGCEDYQEAAKVLLEAQEDPTALVAWFFQQVYETRFPPENVNTSPFADTGAAKGHVRFHVKLGSEQGFDEDGIRAKLVEWTELTPEDFPTILLRSNFCYVEVPEAKAKEALSKFEGASHNDEKVSIEPAKPQRPREGREGRGRDGRRDGRRDRKGGRREGGRDGGRRDGRRDRGEKRRGRRPRRDGEEGQGEGREARPPRSEGGDEGKGDGRRRRRRRPRGKGEGAEARQGGQEAKASAPKPESSDS